MGSVCVTLLKTIKLFSRVAEPFILPPAVHVQSGLSTSSPAFGNISMFYFSHPDRGTGAPFDGGLSGISMPAMWAVWHCNDGKWGS